MRAVRLSEERVAELEALADHNRLKVAARELSRQFRERIVRDATLANVPSIKYKHQWLLEEVVADMESFV